MDNTITKAVQEALELLRAGKKGQAHAILVPIVKQNPDVAQAWYLLGFTVADPDKRLYCFQQVLRIDPAHKAAQKELARLTVVQREIPEVGTFQVHPFSNSAPAFVDPPMPEQYPTFYGDDLPAPAPQVQVGVSEGITPRKLLTNRPMVLIGIALAVVGMIAVLGVTALYVSNGANVSQQVDALFAQRKCAEVVEYTSFGNSFPRVVFSSFFGVYHQVEECQAQLALQEALKVPDWPTAYGVIQGYILEHPNGVFVAEMSEQAGTILLAWSKNLVAQNDYQAATEKLEILQRGFSTSSVAPAALKTMFDDYLLWAKYSYDQKDYENAEKVLKLVGFHEKASPEQVKQADQGLVAVYLQWGKAQIESGQYKEGVQHYEDARNLDNSIDYERLENQVPLIQADALAKTADFDGALAIVKNTLEKPLSEESKADTVAEQVKLLDAYAHSLSPQARAQMAKAATNMCKRQPLTTAPIFGMDADNIRFAIVAPLNLQLPNEWTARTPAELHYIVCIDQSQSSIEVCSKKGGSAVRYRAVWELRLYDVLTGELYKATSVFGSRPGDCDQAGINDIYGDAPKMQQVVDWLTTLNILR